MKVLISGQAGVALLMDDGKCWSVSVEEPDLTTPCAQEEFHYLLSGSDDVVSMDTTTAEDARAELQKAWCRDRVLQMTLILLDREEDTEIREMAAECLEDRLSDPSMTEILMNRLCESPLPDQADTLTAVRTTDIRVFPRTAYLLSEVIRLQPAVRAVCSAFEDLDDSFFTHSEFPSRAFLRRWLSDHGVFRRLAREHGTRIDYEVLTLLAEPAIKRLLGADRLLSAWIAPLKELLPTAPQVLNLNSVLRRYMQNITGPPVDGDDFFDRKELKHLRNSIEAGNHVLLLGPRRIGKSSLIAELARQLTENGWTVASVDAQDATDEAAFLHKIHHTIRQTELRLPLLSRVADATQRFLNYMRGTKIGTVGTSIEVKDVPADWGSAATSLKMLIGTLPGNNRRVLIAIDELPIFLTNLLASEDGLARVQAILDWLRSVRQSNSSKLPWILCGSIGLDSFVAKHHLEGSINDLLPLQVDALDTPQAVAMLKRLGENPEHACPISDKVAQAMTEKVGSLCPYYLQLLFHGLKDLPSAARSAMFPSKADIDAAYESLLSQQPPFGHWDSRLGDLLDGGDEEANARRLLDHLSEHPAGRTRDQLRTFLAKAHPHADPSKLDRMLQDLLDFLVRHGYLGRSRESYAFRSFLLRDYWQRRFGT